MLNRLLMEMNCPPAKGPPANVPPKQANPIELKRALAAITTRRKTLNAVIAKLGQLPPGTYAHECQKLRVQTATAWLNFTVTRWKMLSEFSKKYGKKHPDTDKLTAFGDVHAGHAEHHAKIAHTDEKHPPLADIEFNHEKGGLYHAGTKHPFEIPHNPHQEVKHPGKGAAPAPEKEEPEEEPAKKAPEHEPHPAITDAGLQTLSPEQQKSVLGYAKNWAETLHPGEFDAHGKLGDAPSGHFASALKMSYHIDITNGAAHSLLSHFAKPPAPKSADDYSDADTDKIDNIVNTAVKDAGGYAGLAVAGKESALQATKEKIAAALKDAGVPLHPGSLDHELIIAMKAEKAYADASEKEKADAAKAEKPGAPPEPKNYDDYSPSDQAKIGTIAADYAYAYSHPAGMAAFDQALQKAGVPLTPANAKLQLGYAAGFGAKPKNYGDYNPDSQDKIDALALKHAAAYAGAPNSALEDFKQSLAAAGVPLHHHAAKELLQTGAKGHAATVKVAELDAPGPSGDHPWALSDYTSKEKEKITHVAKELIAELPGTFFALKKPTEAAISKFKLALDQAKVPLKHVDAVAQLQAAVDAANAPLLKPVPTPPPPPGPATALTPDQHEKLKEKVKEHLLASAGGVPPMTPAEAKQLLKDVGVDDPSHFLHALPHTLADEHLKELEKLTPDHVAQLATEADEILASHIGYGGTIGPSTADGTVAMLQAVAATKLGKIPSHTVALDIVNSAIEKMKAKPQPFSDYSNQEKEEIHQAAKQLAVKYATLNKDHHEFKLDLGQHLAQSGKPLSQAAIATVADNAWANHTNQSWNALSADKKEMLKAIAKKAFTSKGDLVAAIANSGIAHLSPEGFKGLADEVAKEAAPPEDEKPAPSLGALKTQVFNYWDGRVAKGETPDEWTWTSGAAAEPLAHALADHKPFSALYGQHQNTWLHSIWSEWFEAYKAKKAQEPAAEPTAPAPHPAAEGPAPPPATTSPTHFTYTKHKKIMDAHHLTSQQKEHLDHKIAEGLAGGAHLTASGEPSDWKLAGLATKIHAEFKNDWGAAGVTGVSKDLIKQLVQEAAAKPHAPEGVAPSPTTHDPPAAQPDDYLAMIKAAPAGTLNGEHHAAFVDIATKVFVQKKWGGDFASPKQKKFFESMLKKVKAALPATPTAPPPKVEPEPTPAPVPEITDETPESNPIGMTKEQLDKFISTDKPNSGPSPPSLTHPGWKKKSAFGGGGAHDKQFLATDKNFHPTGKTFKTGATHAWMFKGDAGAPFIAHGEAAAGRLQKLLGIGATDHIWVETDHNGVTGVMQHFEANPSFRDNGEPAPWKTHIHKDKIAKQLQKAVIANWLNDDYDDHDGNFVVDAKGNVTPVDHGQAARFFDSSMTLTKKLNWQVPNPTASGFQSVSQDPGKGFPGKMLRDWSNGEDIALMPLTSPEFESVIARAESIPSDTYKKMWKPYAEGSVQKFGAVAGYSAVKSDQNVDGFLDGMDVRRKKVRSEVGDFYAQLAKQRAASLKAKGDVRPISAIESEVRDQMGIDEFLQGKPVVAKVDKKALAKAVEEHDAPGWDESKLPTTSYVPHDELLTKTGDIGVDMMAGGDDVKDGRFQFYTIGNNRFVSFHLESPARKKLMSRISGGAQSFDESPPQAPEIEEFEPPPKPTFSAKGGDFHKKVIGAAGDTGSATKTLPDGTVVPVTKIEKYIYKHFKEGAGGVKYHYLQQGIQAATAASQSADPVEKAAGEHYLSEFKRLGHIAPDGAYALKAPGEIPADEQEIKRFEPAKEHLAAQKKAKANVEAAHAQAVEDAKKIWEENKKKAEEQHAAKLATWEKKKQDFAKKLGASGSQLIPATQLDHYPVPDGAKRAADPNGVDEMSTKSKWAGVYKPSFDSAAGAANPMSTYDIDLTDIVTGTAVAGGALTGKKRLLVNFVPDHTKGTTGKAAKQQEYVARNGQVRIQFPEGSTKEQIAEMMQKVGKALNVDVRPASHEDQELNYLRRMAWLRKLEGHSVGSAGKSGHFYEQEPDGSVKDKIEFWAKKFQEAPTANKSTLGYDPRYQPEMVAGTPKTVSGQVVYKKNANGTPKANPHYQPIASDAGSGRFAFRRFDVTDEEIEAFRNQGGRFTQSGGVAAPLNSMCLISTEKRHKLGIKKVGASPTTDVRTGGANDIFLRLNKHGGGGYDSFEFDPEMLAWTALWAPGGSSDPYGAKVSYNGHADPAQRAATVQEQRMAEMMSGAVSVPEATWGDKLDLARWATKIRCGSAELRDKALEKLKAAGITHMGPKKLPVAQVVVI